MIVKILLALGRTRGPAERSLRATRGSEIGSAAWSFLSTDARRRDGRWTQLV